VLKFTILCLVTSVSFRDLFDDTCNSAEILKK
jgi:hypothetical protein